MPASSLRCAWIAAFACHTMAQTIHHVGLGGFAQIRDAILAAAPNDVIEVAAGTYLPFTLDKPLTITALPALPGQIVQVRGVVYGIPMLSVFRPPNGTRAFVTGVHFRNDWLLWPQEIRVDSGTVCFEECTFESYYDSLEPGLRVRYAEVVLRRCLLLGANGSYHNSPALTCDHGSVFAIDCFIRGGNVGVDPSFFGADGITVDDSLLHLVRVDVVGGDSNPIPCQSGFGAGPGVRVRGASNVWIADCTLRGGDGMCTVGGNALRNQTTTPVQLARTTLTGGPGNPPGQASFGPTQQVPLLGLTGSTVGLVRGQPWVAHYRTEPGWPVAVLFAPDVLVSIDPRLAERLLLPAGNLGLFAILVADNQGNTTLQTTVPTLPILLHQHAYLQAVSGLALPARTQPPLGGVIR